MDTHVAVDVSLQEDAPETAVPDATWADRASDVLTDALGVDAMRDSMSEPVLTTPIYATDDVHALRVFAEDEVTFVAARDRSFWGWGTNREALFQPVSSRGDDVTPRTRPQRVTVDLDVREVGPNYCILAGPVTAGSVYCWGGNSYISLRRSGDSWDDWMYPRRANSFVDVLHLGGTSECVRSDHSIWVYYRTPASEQAVDVLRGHVIRVDKNLIVQTEEGVVGPEGDSFFASGLHRLDGVVDISPGLRSDCLLLSTGRVMCWGRNEFGEVGNGYDGSEICNDPLYGPGARIPCVRNPTEVAGLTDVVQVDAGGGRVCARLRDGTVWCWGFNGATDEGLGILGDGRAADEWCVYFDVVDGVRREDPTRRRPCRRHPVQVAGLTDAVDISVGTNHQCAVRASGQVVCWGFNLSGELGTGDTTPHAAPTPVRWH